MAVPNTFQTATSAIPLANLDANFAYYDGAFSISGTATTFAGSVTLTSGTGNGVTYLNGSKVLTSGGALVFNGTTLTSPAFYSTQNIAASYNTQVLENTASNGYAQFQFNVGASGANGVASINYAPGIFFALGPTSNDTTTPITFRANNAAEYMRIAVAAGGIGAVGIGYTALTGVGNNGLAVLGNVGIGTSSPTTLLTVSAKTNDVEALRINALGASGGVQGKVDLGFGYYDSGVAPSAAIGLEEYGTGSTGGSLLFKTRPDGSADSTRPTERMRIDYNGNVGIGTSSPGAKLDVQGASGVIRNTSTTGTNQVYTRQGNTGGFFYSGIDTDAGGFLTGAAYSAYLWMTGAYPMIFATSNAERMRIDSSGNLLVGVTSANANGGVLQLKSGITFPGTQVSASDVNTLDDYEEGTWTPTISSTGTAPTITGYSARSGLYTKIGNLVTAHCYIRATLSAIGTGTPSITGLPFSAGGSALPAPAIGLRNLIVGTAGPYLTGTTAILDGATWALVADTYLCFTVSYQV